MTCKLDQAFHGSNVVASWLTSHWLLLQQQPWHVLPSGAQAGFAAHTILLPSAEAAVALPPICPSQQPAS